MGEMRDDSCTRSTIQLPITLYFALHDSLRDTGPFTELGEPVPGRVIFELPDVFHSDFHLLHPYQEAFAEWKQKHEQKG